MLLFRGIKPTALYFENNGGLEFSVVVGLSTMGTALAIVLLIKPHPAKLIYFIFHPLEEAENYSYMCICLI